MGSDDINFTTLFILHDNNQETWAVQMQQNSVYWIAIAIYTRHKMIFIHKNIIVTFEILKTINSKMKLKFYRASVFQRPYVGVEPPYIFSFVRVHILKGKHFFVSATKNSSKTNDTLTKYTSSIFQCQIYNVFCDVRPLPKLVQQTFSWDNSWPKIFDWVFFVTIQKCSFCDRVNYYAKC